MFLDRLQKWVTILYILSHATIFAWLEVEMEGKHGWAVNLPTSCAFGGWTWYHIAMNLIVLLSVGAVTRGYDSIFKNKWEKYVAGVLLYVFRVAVWFCVEDIMWFVINKHYGIRKYTKHDIFWHADKTWILGTILLNWFVLIGAIILGFVEKIATKKFTVFVETGIATLFLVVSCLISLSLTYDSVEGLPDKSVCFGSESTAFNYTTDSCNICA